MQITVMEVTPQYALELLRKNVCNRRLMKSRVQVFEQELRRGELQLTHQGIAVSESGRLLDGQHRLHAIVNTGITATLAVATGMPESSFKVLDTGAKRSASDVLGIGGAQNKDTLAAAIRQYLCYLNAPNLVWSANVTSKYGSTTQISAEYESDTDAWHWASTTAQTASLRRIVVPGSMACLIYLATVHAGFSREYAAGFANKLKCGDNLSAGDPILAYRNRGMLANGHAKAQARLADYIKLFNAYTTGQQLKMFKSQSFPPMPSLVDVSECLSE